MASLIAASSAVISVPREVTGSSKPMLKSAFIASGKASSDEWSQKTSSNGSRVSCMLTWQPYNNKRFETLSYLPPLTDASIAKEIDYMINNGWFPCLEFSNIGTVYREFGATPGYYDGRYWTMWKLPMFGCKDSSAVLREIEECKKAFPNNYVRVLGFDNVRQVQCAGFLVHKP